jgi:hypothetical protein
VADREQSFTVEQISQLLGAPRANVETHWPTIRAALEELGMDDRPVVIAALATIGVEVVNFAPINEFGTDADFEARYGGREDLGNLQPGDGARYHGRGFIQLTGRINYRGYGRALGVPLEESPDLALDPAVSARVLARYFKDRGVDECARHREWELVRRKVNGGLNGFDHFKRLVEALEAQAGQAASPAALPVRFRVSGTGGDGVKVRARPDVGAKAIGALREGAEVPGEEFAWRWIRLDDGTFGWVANEFLQVVPASRSVASSGRAVPRALAPAAAEAPVPTRRRASRSVPAASEATAAAPPPAPRRRRAATAAPTEPRS